MADSDLASPLQTAVLDLLRRRSPIDDAEIEESLRSIIDVSQSQLAETIKELLSQRFIARHLNGYLMTDDGERYLISATPATTTEEEHVGVADHPLKPYDVAKLKVEQRPVSVFQALRKIDKKEIVLDPEFQRAFVWDVVRQSRLIESILIRIPLPAFYIDATDEVKWSVVDGLQRLTTLHRFCRGESFALTGLEFLGELSGLRFLELPKKYQVLIEDDTQLIFNNLLPGTPAKAKFTIFSRVNTGGMQLTAQEIRHALLQGNITKLLRTLASSSEFLKATGGALESLRMTDREVILRAISFMYFGHSDYRRYDDLDGFLVGSMERFNLLPDGVLTQLGNEFKSALLKVHSIFGKYSFRKYYAEGGRRSPFNKALFEAWVFAVKSVPQERLSAQKERIRAAFLEVTNKDEDFLKSITASTGQPTAVDTRFTTIERLVKQATE